MANKKAKKDQEKLQADTRDKVGFFKRFAMVFESIFIISITALIFWLTPLLDLPQFALDYADRFGVPLAEVITKAFVVFSGLIILLTRYSFHLRKKVKQQQKAEEDIKQLAFFDRVTNLPNQALCENRLEHAIARASRNNTSITVLYIAIDDFKSVNDKHGHEGGDKLLQQLAKRLSSELRSGDTLARITGVEFIIMLESQTPNENISAFAETVQSKLKKCYRISMQEVHIASNIGIATYPTDGEHSKELLKNADTAMCFAKEQGRNSLAFFSKELQEKVNAKQKIATKLLTALANKEFKLHYQPIIDSHSGSVIGVEALLRWHNDLLGDLAPDVFIPIAEEIGIISHIGDWVLSQACKQNKTWQQQGFSNLTVSINLSVMQLGISDYAETVSSVLAESQLEPHYLALEFTEKVLMQDTKQSIVQLRQLRALGVLLVLDDFGMGYSSLKYLPRFKLTTLKIDGSFISNVPHSAVDVLTSRTIVALAKELSLLVIAEGVEKDEQREFVESLGVDAMQGYHFSRPVDVEAFSQLLQAPPWLQG